MLQKIQIDERVFAMLRECMTASDLREACGFLLGSYDGETAVVKEAYSATNAAGRYGSFAIADYERYRIERLALRLDLELIAVYHSHPRGDGRLSEADQQCLGYSNLPWIIIHPASIATDTEPLFVAYAPSSGTPIPVEIWGDMEIGQKGWNERSW
jgi:proteasome lid subunit RPN8/RPN11